MNHLSRTVHLLLFMQLCGVWLFGQELVPANGHRLFLDCQGAGPGPAVILLAGGGGTTSTWDKVQPAVAAFTRVCSYDRAGLGKSSPVRKAQSADQIVDDLADLLTNAHVPAPYVLAGHSIGGLYGRRFTADISEWVRECTVEPNVFKSCQAANSALDSSSAVCSGLSRTR
jgi:pimeloyl-ACP methyl ester carboxylesterase